MKALEHSYQILALLCVCPPDDPTNKWIQWRNTIISALTIVLIMVPNVASIVFMVQYFTIDLASAFCACYQAAALTKCIYTLFVAYIIRDDIKKAFDALQAFYDSIKDRELSRFMDEANERSAWIVKLAIKIFTFAFPNIVLSQSILSAISSYAGFGYLNDTVLYRPYKYALPWDQHTPWGWFGEVVGSWAFATSYLSVDSAFLTLFMSICEFHDAFFKMFQFKVGQLSEINSMQKKDVRQILHEAIFIHVSAERLFRQTAKVYQTFILIQLVGSMVTLACSGFQMDLVIHDMGMGVVVVFQAMVIVGLHLFVYCFNGQKVTDFYAAYDKCLYDSNWMDLPINLQLTIVPMIRNAQKPFYYHGSGIINLNLETYAKMMKTTITYYLMFKTLTVS